MPRSMQDSVRRHPVSHADFRQQIHRSGRIGFHTPAQGRHQGAQGLGIRRGVFAVERLQNLSCGHGFPRMFHHELQKTELQRGQMDLFLAAEQLAASGVQPQVPDLKNLRTDGCVTVFPAHHRLDPGHQLGQGRRVWSGSHPRPVPGLSLSGLPDSGPR